MAATYKDSISGKKPVPAKEVNDKLWELLKDNETIQALKTENPGQYETLVDKIRKLAFCQTAAAYTTSISPGDRIGKADYESFAQTMLRQNKVDIAALSQEEKLKYFHEFCSRLETIRPYTRNQTPHPTLIETEETLDREAEVVDLLTSGMRDLLLQGKGAKLDENVIERFNDKISALADSLVAPLTNMNISDETRTSLRQSRHILHSAPEEAMSLLRVAEKIFGLDPKDATVQQTAIRAAAKAVRNETWSPGDVDSKPHMRPELYKEGIRKGRLAIRQQYITELAEIAAQLPEDSPGKDGCKAIVWKLMNDIEALYPGDAFHAHGKLLHFVRDTMMVDGASEKATQFVAELFESHNTGKALRDNVRYTNNVVFRSKKLFNNGDISKESLDLAIAHHEQCKLDLQNYFKKQAEKKPDKYRFLSEVEESGFALLNFDEYISNTPKFLKGLETLADYTEVQNIKYRDLAGQKTELSAIDALRVKAESYGFQAQRVTHRQTRDAYEVAMDNIHASLVEKFGNRLDIGYCGKVEKLATELSRLRELKDSIKQYKAQIAEAEAEGLPTNGTPQKLADAQEKLEELEGPAQQVRRELTQQLITLLKSKDEQDKELASQIRQFLQDETAVNMSAVRSIQRIFDAPSPITPEQQDFIYTYESLEMIRLGLYNDGAVARELIAETRDAGDLWNVMALQELMIDPENPPLPQKRPRITPLVEYTEDLRKFDQIMTEAYSFEPFRDTQREIVKNHPDYDLKIWDDETQQLRDLTTRDIFQRVRTQERYGEKYVVEMLEDLANNAEPRVKLPTRILENAKEYIEAIAADRQKIYDNIALPENERKEDYNTLITRLDANQKSLDTLLDSLILSPDSPLKAPLDEPVYFAEGMFAGSDSYKSSSTAFMTTVHDKVGNAQRALAGEGFALIMKSGNGSAAHRNAIHNVLTRMRQGREMWRGAEILQAESERGRALAGGMQDFGKLLSVEGDRRFKAVVNMGNAAGLADHTSDRQYETIRERNEQRVDAYIEELYQTPAFSKFVGSCAPMKLFDLYKYAARPANRLKAKGEFSVKDVRAIGFGLNNAAMYGQPISHYGLAERVLKTDEQGQLPETQRYENALLYLKSPDLQDQVNRAVVDLVHFNPDIGWRNTAIGCGLTPPDDLITRVVNETTGEITIRIGGEESKQEFSLNALSKMEDKAVRNKLSGALFSALGGTDSGKTQDDIADIISNMQVAATLDLSGTKALRAINQLMSDLSHDLTLNERDASGRRKPVSIADTIARKKNTPPPPLELGKEADSIKFLVEKIGILSPQLGDEYTLMQRTTQGTEDYKGSSRLISDYFELSKNDPQAFPKDKPGVEVSKPKISLQEDTSQTNKDAWKKYRQYTQYMEAFQAFKQHTDIAEYVPAAYYEPGYAVATAKIRHMPAQSRAA